MDDDQLLGDGGDTIEPEEDLEGSFDDGELEEEGLDDLGGDEEMS